MDESAFLNYSDELLAWLEGQVCDMSDELDAQFAGNVLTVEADGGLEVIVNRHAPNQELWIAAPSGGHHFRLEGGRWASTRDGAGFFEVLERSLREICPNAAALRLDGAPKLP